MEVFKAKNGLSRHNALTFGDPGMSRLLLVATIICLSGTQPAWSDDLVKDSSLDSDTQSNAAEEVLPAQAVPAVQKSSPSSAPAKNTEGEKKAKVLQSASPVVKQSVSVAKKTVNVPETTVTAGKGPKFHGMADYYHHSMYGNKTASGKLLHKHLKTAAHRTLPFGTRVRVTNKSNGKSCVVVVNDRGPFTPSKIIDLSHAAAVELGMLQAGTCKVTCEVLD